MNPFIDLGAIELTDRTLFLNGAHHSGDFRDLLEFNETAHVMLSGGCDSQAMSSWLMHCGVPQRTYTYSALWGQEVINSNDVIQAQRFADRHNLDHTVIDFDLKEFYDSHEYIEVAKRYQCRSPQIAVHLKFMEQLGTNNLVTGGEVPIMAGNEPTKPAHFGMSTNLFLNYHSVYKRFGEINSVDVHRNWFWSTPEIFWASMRFNIDVVIDGSYYNPMHRNHDEIAYKNLLYRAQGFDIMPLAVKLTGFEHLKRILACETGIYDEYDTRYRVPLRDLVEPSTWDSLTFKTSSDLDDLIEEYSYQVVLRNPKNVAQYRFDF